MTRFYTLALAAALAGAIALPAAAQKRGKADRVISDQTGSVMSDDASVSRAQARDVYRDGRDAYGNAYIGDGVDGPLYAPYAPGQPGACITDEGYGRYYSCDGGQ